MNYETKEGTTVPTQTYPIMKKIPKTDVIVAFIGENQGTCMQVGRTNNRLFQFSSTWKEVSFTEVVTSITITQK